MKIGFTLDEKELKNISVKEWIEKSYSLGARAIELSPDLEVMDLESYLEIAKTAGSLDMDLNFHIPYFASELYNIKGFFNKKEKALIKYEEFFNILEKVKEFSSDRESVIVVHGEEFDLNEKKNFQSTLDFLNYLLHALSAKGLNHRVAIESLRLSEKEKVGNSRSELLYLISLVKDARLGICLDICHDSMNYFPSKVPHNSSFYENIIYAHIHGYDLANGKNHIDVLSSSISYMREISYIKKIKPDLTLNIESLSDFVGSSYLSKLFKDIEFLKKQFN